MNKDKLIDQQKATETQSHLDVVLDDSSNDSAPGVDGTNQAQKTLEQTKNTDALPKEIGGRKGLEPTRYGDWEKNGRCIDF